MQTFKPQLLNERSQVCWWRFSQSVTYCVIGPGYSNSHQEDAPSFFLITKKSAQKNIPKSAQKVPQNMPHKIPLNQFQLNIVRGYSNSHQEVVPSFFLIAKKVAKQYPKKCLKNPPNTNSHQEDAPSFFLIVKKSSPKSIPKKCPKKYPKICLKILLKLVLVNYHTWIFQHSPRVCSIFISHC